MSQVCQRCNNPIPDDFQTPLCLECYHIIEEENTQLDAKCKEEMAEQVKNNKNAAVNEGNIADTKPITDKIKPDLPPDSPVANDNGVKDPNYQENPEKEDKDQILANIAQFVYTHDPSKARKGKLLWYPTRNMYNFIKDYCIKQIIAHPQYPKYIWKPKIVDVGCGCGVGSNIMSQEADFVWGIDKNEWSIEFAREAFTRIKNGIYYNPQVTFDNIDIMTDTREFMKFDLVVAIEVFEHIADSNAFLKSLIQFTKKNKKGDCHIDGATEFFISTPNRNSKKIKKDKPENPFHVRELTSEEFHDFLLRYFEVVNLLDSKGQSVEVSCADDLVLAHCKYPKI